VQQVIAHGRVSRAEGRRLQRAKIPADWIDAAICTLRPALGTVGSINWFGAFFA